MPLDGYTTVQSEHVELLASELAKRELSVIDQLEPIADFEELYTFAEAHPTPIEFAEQNPAWRLESVAARVIEAIALAAHEPLNDIGWRSLARILLAHTEYLYTYPEAPTARERLSAGIALALAGSVCASLPQSALWRLSGFGRIASTLTAVSPTSADSHVIQPLDTAFLLASRQNLPILDSAIVCYSNVLNRDFNPKNQLQFPLRDRDFFTYLNLEFQGLQDVKSAFLDENIEAAKSAYTTFRTDFFKNFEDIPLLEKTNTFSSVESYLNCLLKLSIYPTPPISATTEIGIAALIFPEFRICEQLLALTCRRYKWIVDAFFYPDGFHKDKSLRSQTEAILDFSRFLSIYDKSKHVTHFECVDEMKSLLEKQLETCIYISQPDLSFPPLGANPVSDNLSVDELCKVAYIGDIRREDFRYITSSRKHGCEPQELSYIMPYTGYYVMRDSWKSDAQYLIFDSGGSGKHGCGGPLSFVLSAHGQQLITHDCNNQDSSRTKGEAQNVILIDGKRQSTEPEVIPAPDTRWITTSTFDFVEGWYKTSDYHFKRSIFYVKGEYFILHDLVLGDGNHMLEQIFHLDTCSSEDLSAHILADACQVRTQKRSHSNIFIGAVDTSNLTVVLNENRFTFLSQRNLPTVLNAVLFPMKPNVQQLPTISSVDVRVSADVLATGFTISSNSVTDTFLISDDGFATMSTSETDEKIDFEGEYLFLRGDKFVMLNGRFLKVGTKVFAASDEPTEHYVKM